VNKGKGKKPLHVQKGKAKRMLHVKKGKDKRMHGNGRQMQQQQPSSEKGKDKTMHGRYLSAECATRKCLESKWQNTVVTMMLAATVRCAGMALDTVSAK
jgi:hypothetical protein